MTASVRCVAAEHGYAYCDGEAEYVVEYMIGDPDPVYPFCARHVARARRAVGGSLAGQPIRYRSIEPGDEARSVR